jgi:hypothetical protein
MVFEWIFGMFSSDLAIDLGTATPLFMHGIRALSFLSLPWLQSRWSRAA